MRDKCRHRFLVVMLLSFASALGSLAATGQTVHIAHCAAGCPVASAATNDLVVRNLYAASINSDSGVSDWVAYRVLGETVGVASLLPREWEPDPLLPDSALTDSLSGSGPGFSQPSNVDASETSYRVAEFNMEESDKGRLAPMSSFAGTPFWPDINLLSNLAFMNNSLRLGAWSRLDQAINGLAAQRDEVFVIAGPLYQISNLSTARNTEGGAQSPSAFFKVVANSDGAVAAFLMPQDLAQHASHCDQLIALEDLEALSSMQFFPRQEAWPLAALGGELRC